MSDEKLKVFESFAGVGSQRMALRNLGIEHEVVGISEIDGSAILSYAAIHTDFLEKRENIDEYVPNEEEMREYLKGINAPLDYKTFKSKVDSLKGVKLKEMYLANVLSKNYGDITKINPKELPDMDLFTYSFPCFIEGTKIMTDNGYKNIEEINQGDRVLTHTNTYKEVIKPMINHADHIYELDTMCSEPLYVTKEHPFYVRKKRRVWNENTRSYKRVFESPEWVKVKDLSKDYYVGIAINQESKLPKWEGTIFKWNNSKRTQISNILKDKFNTKDFWWLIGRYIGDGWIRHNSGIIICSNFNNTHEIIEKLNNLQFNYCVVKERTVDKVHISFKELGEYVEQFGRGASNKRLTGDVLNLPTELLKSFIKGYLSADGCIVNGVNKISSVSSDLIYGIGQCVAKVYYRPFSIYKTIKPKTHIIEGRVVNQRDVYTICWKNECNKQDHAFYEDNYIWCPINNLKEQEYNGLVYNMEVEGDNSYTANNIIVHNCQDLSVAGKQKGLEIGTRSGLLYECEKIIETKRPKYLLLENVKNLVGKKFKPAFDKWLEYLNELGYQNYWDVLNAKNFNIPQNRERVYVVSVRKDVKTPFAFTNKHQNNIRLKDILEDKIDEKYYLSKDVQNRFKSNGKEDDDSDNINIVGTTAPDFRTIGQRDITYGINGMIGTLAATDYKQPKQILDVRLKDLLEDNVDEKYYISRSWHFSTDLDDKHDSNEIAQIEGIGYKTTRSVTDSNKICRCLDTMGGGQREPKILVVAKTNDKFDQESRIYDQNGLCPTLMAGTQDIVQIDEEYRIRKLTPKECWRLMGFTDEDFSKAEQINSNTQLYKQAGNSIVVNVLEAIFENLLKTNKGVYNDRTT